MAFTIDSFQVFASIPGASAGENRALASYSTNDTKAAVETASYFDAAVNYLPLGSQIFVAGDLDGTPWQAAYVVSANDGSTVTITVSATASYTASYALTVEIEDISTASQSYVVVPVAGEITKVYSVLNGAITGADAGLTVKVTAGTVATMTVAHSGSAAGDVDTDASLANTTVAAGDTIEVETDGASTNAIKAFITILIDPS